VRKATLNGPKPFGYFWAPKVTKNLFSYIFNEFVIVSTASYLFSFFKKIFEKYSILAGAFLNFHNHFEESPLACSFPL